MVRWTKRDVVGWSRHGGLARAVALAVVMVGLAVASVVTAEAGGVRLLLPLALTAALAIAGTISLLEIARAPRKRAEERLQASEARFRSVFEQAALGMGRVRFDDARWMDVNEAFCNMLGRSRDEMLQTPWPEMTHPEDVCLDLAPFRRMAAGELDSYTVEKRFLHRSGEAVWARLTLSLVRDAAGRPDYEIAIVEDIRDRKRAEDALHESEGRLRAVLENMSEGLVLFDAQGNLTYQNPASLRIHGFDPEQVGAIGRDALPATWDAWDEEGRPIAFGDWPASRVMRGERFQGQVLHVRRVETGRVFDASYNGSPIRNAAGEDVGGFITIRDISEELRAERALKESEARFHDLADQERAIAEAWRGSEREFRVLVENLYTAVALIDREGRFSLYNARFLELFGLSADADVDNVNSQNWSAWQVHDESGALLDLEEHPVRKATRTRQAVRNQLVGVRQPSGGDLIWMLVSAAPLVGADGALERVICTYHEITDVKRAEEALRRSEERARASEASLLEADQQKNNFLAVLSHELRNPLTPIRNSVYVLERARPGGPQATRALTVVDRQVAYMSRLIDDLLDVTRISRGKIRLQRESLLLNDVVRGTSDDLRELFRAGGIQFEVAITDSPLRACVDRTRIAQVVGNLLQNAAKFTPAGQRVVVSLQQEGGEAVIAVRDTGVGIEPRLVEKLFQPFVQADATLDRTKGGLGLGLALVKGLVELHGGHVSASSDGPGAGAEFRVRLPLQESERATVRHELGADDKQDARSFRVLLIEDNLDAAESLKEALELNGHEVETAPDGPVGIEKARVFRPDVVLCDIGLPGMDGFEVARTMRNDPALRSTCLVALSGYAGPEDVERAREAGFARHLAKPPSIEALESTLAQACGS